MPFYVKESNFLPELAGIQSALIVPCRFCPAVSLAVKEKKPYLQPFRRLLRTEAFESFVKAIKQRLEAEGIRTAVFDSKLPHQLVACMWTSRRRRELARRAEAFDAALVLGCNATTETVRNAMGSNGCRIIQGMDTEGIVNLLPKVSFPFDVTLEKQGITPVRMQENAGQ